MKKFLVLCLCVGMMALLFTSCDSSPSAFSVLFSTASKPDATAPQTTAVQTTVTTTQTTVTTTTVPTTQTAPPRNDPPEWKTAYLRFIEDYKDQYASYALVYIDGDAIPELYLSGVCEAAGDCVCAYKSGNLFDQHLNRIGGGMYNGSGALYNKNGNMGYYYSYVYELSDFGFTPTFHALQAEQIEQLDNGEYNLYYTYSVEDMPVSEREYNAATNQAFDFTNARPLYENVVDYDTIREQILNY